MSASEPATTQFSDTTDVATSVLLAVAATTDSRTDDLPSLYEVVDPDALNALFDGGPIHPAGNDVEVTFAFAGCQVSVREDGVSVTPTSDGPVEGTAAQPVAQH